MNNLRPKVLLFLKGMGMGAADIVPGVSGGTIAFITGIYETLIACIRSVNGQALKLLFSGQIKQLWQHLNGNFLVVLLAGIGTAVVTLSHLLKHLLETQPILIWSFFFGLIVASAVLVAKQVTRWGLVQVVATLAGAAIAYAITVVSPPETPEALWFIFISGAVAICAMILPGISGSFILLLLGKYAFILDSIKSFKIDIIITFMLGAVTGLLSFSHLLNFLLKRFHNATVAMLMGFMLGSLNKVWPWKQTLKTFIDRHGVEKPMVQENIMPSTYEQVFNQPAQTMGAVLLALGAVGFVILLEKLGNKKTQIK